MELTLVKQGLLSLLAGQPPNCVCLIHINIRNIASLRPFGVFPRTSEIVQLFI